MVHSTEIIEAGWWVVKAVYYKLVQRNPRGYVLQTEKLAGREVLAERVLVVNHLIRLSAPGVEFAALPQSRKTPRLAAAANVSAAAQPQRLHNPLRILYDKDYYMIESSMQVV